MFIACMRLGEVDVQRSHDFKILFLNQVTGPLFRQLVVRLSSEWKPCLLYTGGPLADVFVDTQNLIIREAPAYDRTNTWTRLSSWMSYFLSAIPVISRSPSSTMLFFVSNPPFIGVLGWVMNLLRKQKYIVLIYDIYPDLLIGMGRVKIGLLSRMWDLMNRLILRRASLVITIAEDMADLVESKYRLSKFGSGRIEVIPNWADIEQISPMAKKDNYFATEHGQVDKFTVLYSGNMGNTHDMDILIEAAKRLKLDSRIHFLFIGSGTKYSDIEENIRSYDLNNVTLLPFQPENILPYSLASGDIGVVAYQAGTEGCILPSKAYYYMAAGLALFVISSQETSLGKMVVEKECGYVLKNSDVDGLVQTIRALSHDKMLLSEYKRKARNVAEEMFSQCNLDLYVEALKPVISKLKQENMP